MNKPLRLRRLVPVLVMFLLALVPSFMASAKRADYCDGSVIGGRSQCYGYFENQDAYITGTGVSLDDVILGGFGSFAAGNVNSLDKFVAFYNTKINSANTNEKMGAAFVILTMLGVPGPSAGGSVANGIATAQARFNEWKGIVLGYNGTGGYGVDFNYTYSAPAGYANSARSKLTNDIIYHYKAAENIKVVRFYSPSGTVAVVERSCSNMIGSTSLPAPISWTVSGHSELVGGKTTVYPGETVYFDHYVKNNGPSSASGVWYDVMQQTDGGTATTHQAGSALTPLSNGEDRKVLTNDPYTPTQADVGKNYCRRVGVQPKSSSNGAYADGSWACVNVRSDYSLYPQVKIGGGTNGTVVVGGTADQQSSVENTATKSDVNANYQSYEFVIPADKSADFSGVFTDPGKTGYPFALASKVADICKDWLSGQYPGQVTCKGPVANGSTLFNSGLNSVDQSVIDAAGYKAGDLICRLLWVDHYDYQHATPATGGDDRRVSLPACVRVSKTPYVQLWGGDVRVGDSIGDVTAITQANVYTSSNLIKGNTLGSWAEYGIFAPTKGVIQSASGGALSGKTGFAGQADRDTDEAHLTFANTSTPKGNWAAPATVASYENSLGLPDGGSTSVASISLDTFAGRGKVTLTNGGNVTVHGTLAGGSLMLFYPTGTVVIDGNILLRKGSYSSLADFSQIVIQAKNVIVTHDVDRVDAWLVAVAQNGTDGGIISTCDNPTTPYYSGLSGKTDSPCNQKALRINGPVMGREVQLRRTFGGEGDNTPAETIDLRADAYLWTMQTANTGTIDTIFTTELPPRF